MRATLAASGESFQQQKTRVSADYRPSPPPPFLRPYPCCVAPFLCVANSNKATLETEYTEKMGRKNHWLVAILTEGTLFKKSIAPLSKIFSKLEFIEI